MKILFIGGTGNISSECAALLAQQGHEILILSRGQNPVPAGYRAVLGDRKKITSSLFKESQPEVVLNFLGYEVADVQLDYEVFQGLVAQYIFISSATVYAKPAPKLPVTEDTPLGNAWWDYAQKKLACEQYLLERWKETAFPVTIVRPSHTYSKRWIPNPVASSNYNFAARLEQGKPVFIPDRGETPWTLTAASDFAVGLAGLVGSKTSLGECFHITSDEVLTWNQIYNEIATALGVLAPKIERVPTEVICEAVPNLTGNLKGDKSHPGIFDNSKIKRFVPEFGCRKPFRVGIGESVEWLRAHPEDRKFNPEVDAWIERVLRANSSRSC